MTLLDRAEGGTGGNDGAARKNRTPDSRSPKGTDDSNHMASSESSSLSEVESQFKTFMAEFNANGGFKVDTGENPVSTMVELLASSDVVVSITILLSYIRYCINHGVTKDITIRIGRNKPHTLPMNFAVNDELLAEIYPGDSVDID